MKKNIKVLDKDSKQASRQAGKQASRQAGKVLYALKPFSFLF